MTTELTLLGKRHMRLRGYGFKSDHWKLFKMSIMLSVASVIENDGNKAWLLVSEILYLLVYISYK